jgi:hypothetical protein
VAQLEFSVQRSRSEGNGVSVGVQIAIKHDPVRLPALLFVAALVAAMPS